MSTPEATVETLYSEGDLGIIPEVGPQRTDVSFEEAENKSKILSPGAEDKVSSKKDLKKDSRSPQQKYYDDRMNIPGSFWAYFVITLVVALFALLFIFDGYQCGKVTQGNSNLILTGVIISFLIIAWAGYRGHLCAAGQSYRDGLSFLFVINLVLFLLWAIFKFNTSIESAGSIVLGLLILETILWIYLLARVDLVSSFLLLLYLIFVVYLFTWC